MLAMTMLRFLISCTFVLAQRTPLNAAFWTVGLDKTLEERRIEPPKRSEEAMVVLSAMRLEKRAEAVLGSFVDEAQRRRKLLELSLENPKLLGERQKQERLAQQIRILRLTKQFTSLNIFSDNTSFADLSREISH
jgi:hypothetical protein